MRPLKPAGDFNRTALEVKVRRLKRPQALLATSVTFYCPHPVLVAELTWQVQLKSS